MDEGPFAKNAEGTGKTYPEVFFNELFTNKTNG